MILALKIQHIKIKSNKNRKGASDKVKDDKVKKEMDCQMTKQSATIQFHGFNCRLKLALEKQCQFSGGTAE